MFIRSPSLDGGSGSAGSTSPLLHKNCVCTGSREKEMSQFVL